MTPEALEEAIEKYHTLANATRERLSAWFNSQPKYHRGAGAYDKFHGIITEMALTATMAAVAIMQHRDTNDATELAPLQQIITAYDTSAASIEQAFQAAEMFAQLVKEATK